MKGIIWLGTSKEDVRAFPDEAKREIGFELYGVQVGEDPSDWKPMPSVGPGVREIRVHSGNEYRVLYVTKLGGHVFVLHAFVKKSQKTSKRDIDVAKSRLRVLMSEVM